MADEKVLEAQKWVNATYKDVSGYQSCPENGKTGWSTVYSLTMGLQHELGISPVVANFGPGTLNRLSALGDLTIAWRENENIVRILRHGLFCKGYWGGDHGIPYYDMAAAAAVNEMKENMGLHQDGKVQPKVFKAILNMDAYVVLAGGSSEVRSVQQWLNGDYWTKSTFNIGPADGHFSRDVQQALMKAIQIESGIPEDQANGNFGPGTREALKSKVVAEGDTGIFVRLFSAACVCNQPVIQVIQNDDGTWSEQEIKTTLKEQFDAKLKTFVTYFQRFSALDDSGKGDYQTWAQLLVSTGDPDRPVTACDTAYTITPSRAAKLYADNYRIVGRYINESSLGGGSKILEEGELEDIFAANLRVFPIFQDHNRDYADFTWGKGYDHGLQAHDQAVHFGFNRGTVIYFACDYDATSDDMPKIVEYFQGVSAALGTKGKRYVMGVYGSRNVCAQVTKEAYARYSFVSGMSTGFSGNLGFPLPANWSFNQIKEYMVSNGSDRFGLDRDAHRIGFDNGQNNINRKTSPADDFVRYISGLYDLAEAYANGNQRLDPNQLVMEYVRHRAYGGFTWWSLIGSYDEGFVRYADDHNAAIWDDFKDPFTGYLLGAEHLMATCNSHYLKPQTSTTKGGAGDVGGWAGDLYTFYGEWRRDVDNNASGYAYCKDRLGKIGVPSTFAFNDLVEDADGYLLAEAVRSQNKTIVQAVEDHYTSTGGVERFKEYYAHRFGGSIASAQNLARYMLTTEGDQTIALGREYLISSNAGGSGAVMMPWMLPSDMLDAFCKGFAEVLHSHTQVEAGNRTVYLKNQRRNLSAQ